MRAINKRAMMVNLLGVIMSGAVFYSMNPVAIAFYTAAYMGKNMRYLLFLATIAGLGIWMPLNEVIRYGTILLLITVVIQWVEKKQQKIPPVLAGVVAMVVSIGVGIVSLYSTGFHPDGVFLVVIEGLLIFALYNVFLKGIEYLLHCKKGQAPDNEELISVVVLFALLVYGIPTFSSVDFSFEETIAYLLILVMGYKYGAGAGAICGTAFGVVMFAKSGMEIGTMCILGICAGVFRKVGKLGAGVAFLLVNIVLGYFYDPRILEVEAVRALASSIVVFLLLPKAVLYPVDSTNKPKEDEEIRSKIQDVARSKLVEFADSFQALSKTFYALSHTKPNLSKSDVNFIFDELSDKLCKNCIHCNSCWKNNFYDTYKAAFSILSSAEQNGEVRKEDIPPGFARQCVNLNSFLYEINRGLEIAKNNLSWYNRMAQSREAIAGQLGEVAAIIKDFSSELYDSVGLESEMQDDIVEYMKLHYIEVKNVSVIEKRNKKQEFYITVRTKGGRCITTREAAGLLGDVLGKRMKPSEGAKNIVSKEFDTILFVEDTNFKTLTGIAKATKQNEKTSGDNFSFIYLNNGQMIMTLSDGMGTGEQACEESQSVIELLEQFMEAGFKEESAIKLINSILVLRADDQTCSTIDMGILDLFTGMCEFIKIGAAASFIKRGEWVETITSTSMPVGMLNEVDMDGVSKKLYDGDIIVMITDGVLDCIAEEDKEQFIANLLTNMKTKNPQDMANEILEHAIEQNNYQAMDDMTVLVAGMWKK